MAVVRWTTSDFGFEAGYIYNTREDAISDMQPDEHGIIEYPNGHREPVEPPQDQLLSLSGNRRRTKLEVFDGKKWLLHARYKNARHAQPDYWDFVEVIGRNRVRIVEEKDDE